MPPTPDQKRWLLWVYSAADLIRLSSRVVAPLIFERDDCRLATSYFAVGFIANDP